MNLLKRIYELLLPEERKKGCRMVVSVFLSALFDFIGLAAMLPVLYYLLDGAKKNDAALFFCIVAVVVIVVKCVFTTFFIRYQNQTLLSFYKRLSLMLFSSFYDRGLLYVREQGSNRLGYAINSMCYAFSHSLLSPIFRMAGDVLLIILVTTALFIWNGKCVMLLYVSFVPFMCIYFLLVKKRVRQYGLIDMQEKREQARVVADTFRGYVELEANGAFSVQQNVFEEKMDRMIVNRVKLDTLMRIPLFLSELSVVMALGLLVLFGHGDIKMMVGVFAVAAFRLLPALRSILSGWTQIQNAICCLDVIEEGLNDCNDENAVEHKDIIFEKNITVDNLTYIYPDGNCVLKNFCCRINKGEHIGFSGISGVGKSTFFNILIGLLEPVLGNVLVDGVPLTDENRKSWIKRIGYVPQEIFIFNGTLVENIALGCKNADKEKILRLLSQVNLDKCVDGLPDGIDTQISEAGAKLSGGQKQRIGIARALYKQADVLLLDEATSALDNDTEREVNNALNKLKEDYKGLTILSIAHRDTSLEYCDRIIKIE